MAAALLTDVAPPPRPLLHFAMHTHTEGDLPAPHSPYGLPSSPGRMKGVCLRCVSWDAAPPRRSPTILIGSDRRVPILSLVSAHIDPRARLTDSILEASNCLAKNRAQPIVFEGGTNRNCVTGRKRDVHGDLL